MPQHLKPLLVVASSCLIGSPILAAPLNTAKVLRLVDGREVFVDAKPASINQTAGKGSILSTRRSRAELLFDTRAIGLLGRNSLIKIGARCFSLDQGVIVVNGPQKACIGTRVLGVRGTTYVAAREEDGTYTVSVLAGEGIVANDLPESESDPNILDAYPTTQPWVGVQAGGFSANRLNGNGLFTGGLTYFTPLEQKQSRTILYSSTSIGSSFQNTWGASTEIGYRWFSAATQSTSGIYLGYGGYSTPGCFSNQLNIGAQWEKSRWRLGASGAVKVNNCPNSLGFGALNLSIPVGRVKERPMYVMVTPYVLTGNASGFGIAATSSANDSAGIRATIDVPVDESVSFRSYIGTDNVFGLIIGGLLSYRIPTRQSLQRDPTMPATVQASQELAQLALQNPSGLLSDARNPLLPAQELKAQAPDGASVIQQGQRGRFSASGELLRIEPIPNIDFTALINGQLKGQNPLPESRRIARLALANGVFSNGVAAILGVDFLENATLPITTTVDTPFTASTQLPVSQGGRAEQPTSTSSGADKKADGLVLQQNNCANYTPGNYCPP